jgi:hypothetical protein
MYSARKLSKGTMLFKRLERIALGANQTLVDIVETQLPAAFPRPANHRATPKPICLGRASAIFRGGLLLCG